MIEKLWRGEIYPQEDSYENTNEAKQCIRVASKCYDELWNTFDENQKNLFEKFHDSQSAVNEITEKQIFVYGFKLGANLMKDMLS